MERHQVQQGDNEQVIILLRILNGVNFNQEKPFRKIVLTATLNQHVLETATRRPVTPGSGTATFDAKLVWVCDRYSVKRMKMENKPIKLECAEALPCGRRCPIGRVVISLRSIPFVTLARTKMIKSRWHRLTGIDGQRWKNRKPEINMLIMITDPKYLETDDRKDKPTMEDVSADEDHAPQQTTIYANPGSDQLQGNAELLEDRGLLQIGSRDTDTDLFLLAIVLKCGQHLDKLASGADTFRLRYQLFGEHYLLHAEREEPGSAVFPIREKITINVRSSLSALGHYLQDTLKIPVDVLSDCDSMVACLEPRQTSPTSVFGKTMIDFVDFLKERDLDEFQRKYASNDCTVEAVRSFPIWSNEVENVGSSNEQLLAPSLKCTFCLRFLANDRHRSNREGEEADKQDNQEPQIRESSPSECKLASPVGCETTDLGKKMYLHSESVKEPDPISAKEEMPSSRNPEPSLSSRLDVPTGAIEKVDIESILLTSEQNLRDIRRTFAFNVRVGAIRFTSTPSSGAWQISLQHPKADTPFTKVTLDLLPDAVHPEQIDFGDITVKLLFSAHPERVMEVIGSEPSKLTLNGPHGMHALALLDNVSLLVGIRERQPSGVAVMVNGSTGENVAIANVRCVLEEVGLNYNSQHFEGFAEKPAVGAFCCHPTKESGNRAAAPFDETIAYQLLEEQKAWLHEQREQFLEELKEKERNHLQTLTHDWNIKKGKEEKRLGDRLAQADAMAVALDQARRRLENHDHEEVRNNGHLERQFREQLEAIRAKALRLEKEAETQIEATRRQCRELQDQLATLSKDHQQLLDTNMNLQRQLSEATRSRAQEVTELRQCIEEISESKLRYKELWAKTSRKVHQLEQDLAVSQTPYYQPSRKDSRKKIHRGGGSQMSMSGTRRGAGDCSSCSFHKPC